MAQAVARPTRVGPRREVRPYVLFARARLLAFDAQSALGARALRRVIVLARICRATPALLLAALLAIDFATRRRLTSRSIKRVAALPAVVGFLSKAWTSGVAREAIAGRLARLQLRGGRGADRPALVWIQATLPAYLQETVDLLGRRVGDGLTVLSGRDYFDPTIRLDVQHPRIKVVSNRFLAGRRLLWQRGALRAVLPAETALLELNPRVLSTWMLLVIRRLLRRPTVLWGHAWPRRGSIARSDAVRHAMRSLADSLVVCSETQARELRLKMPSASIRAAPNAIYSIAQAGEATGPERTTDVVYVGRLVDGKKPQLLLDGFFAAMARLPDDIRLVFVGDGPARADLARRVDRAKSRVRFAGAVWDFPSLKRIYSTAIVGVSPGPGGLSLTQSLWFGVPVLVARGEWHGPEIEAAVEGVNAVFFDADSPSALADALTSVVLERETWRMRRPIIARECAERYSVEAMVDSILATVAEVAREP